MTELRFAFDPDVASAATPPAWVYTRPAFFERERERVFARTWQLVAHTGQLAEPGAFVTAELAGEPLVVVRDGDALRGFFNVCRHRAGPVAVGCGRRNTLQCRYHGWTYALSGALVRAPEMDGTRGFDPAAVRLPAVRVETLGPLVFVNIDPHAPALAEVLEDIPARTAPLGLDAMRHVASRRYELACNWKVYVDNYLEGYHLPTVHPALHRELDYGAYRVETRRFYSRQHAPFRPAAQGGVGASHEPRHYVTPARPDAARNGDGGGGADDDDAQYYWLFPNTMLNLYLGQLQTNVVVPLAPDRTAVLFDWYLPADARADDAGFARRMAFSDAIQAEDAWICETVQKNLGSRSYERGRYAAKRENGVHHFHGLLHAFCERE